MLIDIDTYEVIDYIPHPDAFDLIQERLNQYEIDAIENHINELIDGVGAEIATAGWLPENRDWNGTPLQLIHDTAALQNYEMAGRMFGLMVWYTVMRRPEQWASVRAERDGVPIGSRTYFRVTIPTA